MADTKLTRERSAAELAREVAELRSIAQNHLDSLRTVERITAKYLARAESAESANRALQAEVDRLNRAVDAALELVAKWDAITRNPVYDKPTQMGYATRRDELAAAIAYTGTEPQA